MDASCQVWVSGWVKGREVLRDGPEVVHVGGGAEVEVVAQAVVAEFEGVEADADDAGGLAEAGGDGEGVEECAEEVDGVGGVERGCGGFLRRGKVCDRGTR